MTVQSAPDAAATARRRPLTFWLVILGAAAAALVALVAALGGFNEVPIEKLPVIELGSTNVGSEVETRITGSYLTATHPGFDFEADAGLQYLVVEATMLNTTSTSYVLDSQLIRILLEDEVQPADDPAGFVDATTGDDIDFLQPGLTVDGLFFWEISTQAKAGDALIVGVFDHYPVYGDPIYGDDSFSAPEPTARVITEIGEGS